MLAVHNNHVEKLFQNNKFPDSTFSSVAYTMGSGHYLCVFLPLLLLQANCYEKTLRKIVRNNSKMVHRPFTDAGIVRAMEWSNNTSVIRNRDMMLPGFSQTNSALHKIRRSKSSPILSFLDAGGVKSGHHNVKYGTSEPRSPRNTFHGHVLPHKFSDEVTSPQLPYLLQNQTNTAYSIHYPIPTLTKFFPSNESPELQNLELKTNSKENTIIFPESPEEKENQTIHIKGVFLINNNSSKEIVRQSVPKNHISEDESDKADYYLQGTPVDAKLVYSYNMTALPYTCVAMKEVKTDIDAQQLFETFDIEPTWMERKHFWNAIYDSRYESLMRSTKWPPLKVILVPRTHVDSIWKKTFTQYHDNSVGKILSNMVKKLQFYSNLTFTWNEVSHLSLWWNNTSHKTRNAFKKLLKAGRIEITTGGWVEPDEATTHLFGLVHQLVEGQEWLKHNLNYTPKVGWQTNTVSHSPTMTYLLSASGISRLVLTNLHYSWEEYLAEYQLSDFIWVQSWDSDSTSPIYLNDVLKLLGKKRIPKSAVLTHFLQFNSAGFQACGPNNAVCTNDFNFANSDKNLDINPYNVKVRSEQLLEQYSKTGTITPHNVVMAPLGGPFRFEQQQEFDYQYNNYEKIADFVNINQAIYKATIQFGTPSDYFNTILKKHTKYQRIKGDFMNFADVASGSPAYWTGYFTSRPFSKIMLRRLESTMRNTEILFAFALSFNTFRGNNGSVIFKELVDARDNVARLTDRNVASGTLPANMHRYVHNLILSTVKNCWHIQEVAASLLVSKPGQFEPHLQKYVYREGEFISTFRSVAAGDKIYIFNSLSQERTEIVELVTRYYNLRIIDHRMKEVTVQINPIWKYTTDNAIKISRRFFKVSFVVVMPPMTLEMFTVKDTYDATQSVSTIFCSLCVVDNTDGNNGSIFPFHIQSTEKGDIQLESYKHRLIFDEMTGFLKTVIEKATNIEKSVSIDFGAFKDVSVNSGMFLFNTNVSKPLHDVLMPYRIGIQTKATIIISGQITTEITSIYGRLLQQTIKIFNFIQSPLSNAIYIENKVDYEVSPKYRELEFFMSVQTDISNGQPPVIVTDNNGFQHTPRSINMSRRIESNVYPITNMAYIQDRRSRMTYITDHAQGVTALQEGQLVIMLDRRVLYNDGRGVSEGLADSTATCHKQYILLENFMDIYDLDHAERHAVTLPSISAVYLDFSLNHNIDIFVVDKTKGEKCHYAFMPLIKTSFPCDVSVVNFRVILNKDSVQYHSSNSALLILHRRSVSCRIDTSVNLQCNGDSTFSLEKIMRNIKAVYHTNLAGTNKGVPLLNFSPANFPGLELITLKVYF